MKMIQGVSGTREMFWKWLGKMIGPKESYNRIKDLEEVFKWSICWYRKVSLSIYVVLMVPGVIIMGEVAG